MPSLVDCGSRCNSLFLTTPSQMARWSSTTVLRTRCERSWPAQTGLSTFPGVLLGLRAARREDSGISAAELVYGSPLPLLSQFLTAAEMLPASFIQKPWSPLPRVVTGLGCSSLAASPSRALESAAFVYVQLPPLSPGVVAHLPWPVPGSRDQRHVFRPRDQRQTSGCVC
jgi:hypothetical protein